MIRESGDITTFNKHSLNFEAGWNNKRDLALTCVRVARSKIQWPQQVNIAHYRPLESNKAQYLASRVGLNKALLHVLCFFFFAKSTYFQWNFFVKQIIKPIWINHMFNPVVNPIYVCFLHQSITTSNIFIFDLLVDTHVQSFFFYSMCRCFTVAAHAIINSEATR